MCEPTGLGMLYFDRCNSILAPNLASCLAQGRASDCSVGEWLSLVEHLVRDQGVGGSNPLSPTIFFSIHAAFSDP